MHELGVLYRALEHINSIAKSKKIKRIKHITLEIGELSGYVPAFLEKLYPIAREKFPIMKMAELRLVVIPGRSFLISNIGY